MAGNEPPTKVQNEMDDALAKDEAHQMFVDVSMEIEEADRDWKRTFVAKIFGKEAVPGYKETEYGSDSFARAEFDPSYAAERQEKLEKEQEQRQFAAGFDENAPPTMGMTRSRPSQSSSSMDEAERLDVIARRQGSSATGAVSGNKETGDGTAASSEGWVRPDGIPSDGQVTRSRVSDDGKTIQTDFKLPFVPEKENFAKFVDTAGTGSGFKDGSAPPTPEMMAAGGVTATKSAAGAAAAAGIAAQQQPVASLATRARNRLINYLITPRPAFVAKEPLTLRWWFPYVCILGIALIWSPDQYKVYALRWIDYKHDQLKFKIHQIYWRQTMKKEDYEQLMKEIKENVPKQKRVKHPDCPF